MIIDLDKETFNEYISSGLKIIAFTAKWCSYCQKQYEVFKNLPEIEIGKVDGDKNPELINQFGIMGFPTFIIFKNKEIITKFSGYKNKFEFMNILTKYL